MLSWAAAAIRPVRARRPHRAPVLLEARKRDARRRRDLPGRRQDLRPLLDRLARLEPRPLPGIRLLPRNFGGANEAAKQRETDQCGRYLEVFRKTARHSGDLVSSKYVLQLLHVKYNYPGCALLCEPPLNLSVT